MILSALLACAGSEALLHGSGSLELERLTDEGQRWVSQDEDGNETTTVETVGCAPGDDFSVSATLYSDDIDGPLWFQYQHPLETCSVDFPEADAIHACLLEHASLERTGEAAWLSLSGHSVRQTDGDTLTMPVGFALTGDLTVSACAGE